MELRDDNPGNMDDKIVFTRLEVEKLHNVKAYIDNNLDAKLTITLLAKEFHIGTTRLKQGFRKYFKQTIYRYILKQRMEKAKQLLAAGMRVQLVAAEIGYSLTGFSKIFKNYVGVSPMEYKNGSK
jgi:two-component system, response regulator YesN